MEVRQIGAEQLLDAIKAIDRAEHVDVQYEVVDGELREGAVFMADIPTWLPDPESEHSAEAKVRTFAPIVDAGAPCYVALVGSAIAGVAIVDPDYDLPLAWFALLYVDREHRRTGVASALWQATIDAARAAGATSMYVSASPTGSAVGFYLSRGCRLADPVRPELFEDEPEDVHLVCDLG